DRFAVERLQVPMPLRVRPAWIRVPPQDGVPTLPVSAEMILAGAKPCRLNVSVSISGLEEHFPAIDQTVHLSEVHAPLGRQRHLPFKRKSLTGIFRFQTASVPNLRSFQ